LDNQTQYKLEKTRRLLNASLAAIVVGAGTVTFWWLAATRPHPKVREDLDATPRVEVMPVVATVFDAPIKGYGTVRPKRQVKIIPEVGGRLVAVHPDLAVGNVIHKGELLFQIDPRTYQSQVVQVEAEIQRLESQLKRQQLERESVQARLALAEEQRDLARKSVEREQGLLSQDSATAPELEAAKERLLRHEDSVLTYHSELELIPHQIEETNALLKIKRAQLDEAKLNVERTKIYCPFDARVDSISAQQSQVVIANFQIATITDMEALEVSVVIDPRDLRWTELEAFASAIGEDVDSAPEARVTWTMHGQSFSWSGRVTRLERLDEATRSAHVVVEIRDIMLSLDMKRGQTRPPLSVGMFCTAELPTEPLPNALVVPRHALRDGSCVYVFEPDANDPAVGHLAIKKAPSLRSIGDQVLVAYGTPQERSTESPECELQSGDQLVLSPLPKAVNGMRLELRGKAEGLARADRTAPSKDAAPAPSESPAIFLGSVTGAP
jgi:multidrug efflux pump subunit AcrA (membrane-fusion protein)